MEGAARLLIQAAAPVGGGKAWPGFEIDHSEQRLACGDLAGGPPPTAHQAAGPSNVNPTGARKTVGAHSNKHSNKHNNGGATGLRPRSDPSARSHDALTAWRPRS